VVRDGQYFNVHLLLEPQDSGLYLTSAPGENPVLFGGQRLTGWQCEGEHWQAVDLPVFPRIEKPASDASEPDRWQIRMLDVDGQWMPGARFPSKDFLEHSSEFPVPWMSTTGGGWKRQPTTEELTRLNYPPGQLGVWLTEQCNLLDLKINRTAGHGIVARTRDLGTRVQNCEVGDCGAGGIYVGGTNCVLYRFESRILLRLPTGPTTSFSAEAARRSGCPLKTIARDGSKPLPHGASLSLIL
jgi:hypothetical protein